MTNRRTKPHKGLLVLKDALEMAWRDNVCRAPLAPTRWTFGDWNGGYQLARVTELCNPANGSLVRNVTIRYKTGAQTE